MNCGKLSMRKLLFQAFVLLAAIMCIHISIACLIVLFNPFTSFPWYTPVYLLGMVYIIPVAVLAGVKLLLWIRERI